MIVAGNVGKIDPGQWATIGTQEPTGADTSFDKWNYYCRSVWSFGWAISHHHHLFSGRYQYSDIAVSIGQAHSNIFM